MRSVERGVTLIELLVAMTLLSLLSVGVLFGIAYRPERDGAVRTIV